LTPVVEVEPGGLLLVRFSPMNADGITSAANESADECEAAGEARVYSISTFGLTRGPDESMDDLVLRICEGSDCNGRTVWVAAQTALEEDGFEVQLSEPPPNHYDVILGEELRVPDVEELVKSFEPGRRRNPAWKNKRS
jgi:hypothetical protein